MLYLLKIALYKVKQCQCYLLKRALYGEAMAMLSTEESTILDGDMPSIEDSIRDEAMAMQIH